MGTEAHAISGSNIVGEYIDSAFKQHGFLYNGSTYTALDYPLITEGTEALGISGSNIVGEYFQSSQPHGFLYDGSTYTNLDHPLGEFGTIISGIDGNNIVGQYNDGNGVHSFVATVPEPSALMLCVAGLVFAAAFRFRHTLQYCQGSFRQRLACTVGVVVLTLVIAGATQAGFPQRNGNQGNSQGNNQGSNQGNKQSNSQDNNQNNNQDKQQDKQSDKDKQYKHQDKTPNSKPAVGNPSPGLTVGGLGLKTTETPLQKLNLDTKADKSLADPANKGAALHEGLNGSGTPLGGIISSAKNKHAADKAVTDAQAAKAAANKAYDDAQSAAAISRQQLGSAGAV